VPRDFRQRFGFVGVRRKLAHHKYRCRSNVERDEIADSSEVIPEHWRGERCNVRAYPPLVGRRTLPSSFSPKPGL
jgi:hypothetical protein